MNRVLTSAAMGGVMLAAAAARSQSSPPAFDLVIANGRILDGTGAPWFRGDVGIKGDRITAVGDLSAAAATRRIDARDHMVAPGFIDMLGQSEMTLLADNRAESKVRQGITSEITGEGGSAAPATEATLKDQQAWLDTYRIKVDWTDFRGYFDALRRARPNALILLTTIYDPSDRLGRIPGVLEDAGKLPLHVLDGLNAHIRTLARGTPGVALADVYEHFLGHGASVTETDRWYWRRSLVEPNALGAHQIRRVWRNALDAG